VAALAEVLRPVDEYVGRVAYFLEVRDLAPRALQKPELAVYGWPAVGWAVRLPTAVGERVVDVLLPIDYPHEPARIGVARLSEGRPLAHIAEDLLCLTDSIERHVVCGDESILARDLDRASDRFADDPSAVERDRRAEFSDYWNGRAVRPMLSLITEKTDYGNVVAWHGSKFTLVAPDEPLARSWFRNRFGDDPQTISRALYLPADAIPPNLADGAALHALVDGMRNKAFTEALDDLAAAGVPSAAVVFRLPGPFALVGGMLRRGEPRQTGAFKRKNRHPGFRPDHVPRERLVTAYFEDRPTFERRRLQRVDADWVIARGGEESRKSLQSAVVCLVGVGSLGSGIARALVKAGVGRLRLIDPDILTWDNVARHELGGSSVGSSKANALAASLRRDFPFVRVDAVTARWQDAYRADQSIFDADVVLSTTGDWPGESQLNELLRRSVRPVLMFGWIEPHAAAAHALAVRPDGGCLGCGMNDSGAFAARAVDWPRSQTIAVPACGASYTPYADLAASRARAMLTAELLNVLSGTAASSVLASEVYDEALWLPRDGCLTEAFVERLGRSPRTHGDFVRSPWARHPDCPVCTNGPEGSAV
jgi:hypothetical protein